MALQESFIKFKGNIGDITFRKSGNGYIAYQRKKPSRKTLLNSKGSKHARNLKSEFARSTQYCKQLRDIIRPVINRCKDRYHLARLNASFLSVIKQDPYMPEGERMFNNLGMHNLIGYEFNLNSKLNHVIYAQWNFQHHKSENKITLSISDNSIADFFNAPDKATGFKIVLCTACCNFVTSESKMIVTKSDMNNLTDEFLSTTELSVNLPSVNDSYTITMLGVEFYREINGIVEHLYDGARDSLQIINVA